MSAEPQSRRATALDGIAAAHRARGESAPAAGPAAARTVSEWRQARPSPAAASRPMPNGDPPPLTLWGDEEGG
jgi:hypothetical protein